MGSRMASPSLPACEGSMVLVPLGPLIVTWPTLKPDPATGSALVSPLAAAYSRALERRADAYAVDVTGQGARYAVTFERLVDQNLMELEPPSAVTGNGPSA